MRISGAQPISRGLVTDGGVAYRITSVALTQNDETLATLAVGVAFDLTQFGAPLVLARNGAVTQSSLAGVSPAAIQRALSRCGIGRECETRINGELYLSAPITDLALGEKGTSCAAFKMWMRRQSPRARRSALHFPDGVGARDRGLAGIVSVVAGRDRSSSRSFPW